MLSHRRERGPAGEGKEGVTTRGGEGSSLVPEERALLKLSFGEGGGFYLQNLKRHEGRTAHFQGCVEVSFLWSREAFQKAWREENRQAKEGGKRDFFRRGEGGKAATKRSPIKEGIHAQGGKRRMKRKNCPSKRRDTEIKHGGSKKSQKNFSLLPSGGKGGKPKKRLR